MTEINIKFPQKSAEEMQNFQGVILDILADISTKTLDENQLIDLYRRFQGVLTELGKVRTVPNAIEYLNSQHPSNFGISKVDWVYDVRIPFAKFESAIPQLVAWFIANLPDRIDSRGGVIERSVDTTTLKTIAADLIAKSP